MSIAPAIPDYVRRGIMAELYLITEAIGGVNAGAAAEEAKRLERYLAGYFMTMAKEVSRLDWEPIYAQYVAAADLPKIAAEFLGGDKWLQAPALHAAMRAAMLKVEPVIAAESKALHAAISQALADGYQAGDKYRGSRATTPTGEPAGVSNIQQKSSDWSNLHAGDLVTKMNQTSKQRVGEIVSKGIIDKAGIPGIQKALKAEFTDMSDYRAKMIAWTEMNRAYSTAQFAKLQALGITHKRWIPTDPCPICRANAQQGAILMNDAFQSGDMYPPNHPHCRCTLSGARPPK